METHEECRLGSAQAMDWAHALLWLQRAARHAGGNRADCEDAAQEAAVRAWQAVGGALRRDAGVGSTARHEGGSGDRTPGIGAVATVKTQARRVTAGPAAKAAMAGGGRTVTEAAAGRRELASPLPRLVVATAGRAAWGPLQT